MSESISFVNEAVPPSESEDSCELIPSFTNAFRSENGYWFFAHFNGEELTETRIDGSYLSSFYSNMTKVNYELECNPGEVWRVDIGEISTVFLRDEELLNWFSPGTYSFEKVNDPIVWTNGIGRSLEYTNEELIQIRDQRGLSFEKNE
jgi:hypothetical protein